MEISVARTVVVTGISGFIARHVALALLQAGYAVRGTVRSSGKADAVRATLARHADVSRLDFAVAELGSDEGWAAAVDGAWGIAHLASPFPMAQPRDEADLIRPAVEGTERVLRAAIAGKVARVVQTSSAAAVYPGHPRGRVEPFDEDDWAMPEAAGVTAYEKSKTLAERAARDLVAREGGAMHFATVNPALVLGPALDADIGTSAEFVRLMLRGAYPAVPRVWLGVIDVRDVAEMHVRALETDLPSGGRYLGVADTIRPVDIGRTLRARLGPAGRKAPRHELPDFAVRLVALFDRRVRTLVPGLGRPISFDSTRSQKALGMSFRPAEEAIVSLARSLIELKLV